MDEELVRQQFYDYWIDLNYPVGTNACFQAKQSWLESAKRADRNAREECADIARAHASCEGIAESIEYEIRATIKEE